MLTLSYGQRLKSLPLLNHLDNDAFVPTRMFWCHVENHVSMDSSHLLLNLPTQGDGNQDLAFVLFSQLNVSAY